MSPSRAIPRRIVFIRGVLPRSGTNFLTDVLTCHPSVSRSPGDFWEFVPFRYHNQLIDYCTAIKNSKHANHFSADAFLPYIGSAWLDFLTRQVHSKSDLLIWKEPSVDHLDSMFKMFPDAKGIIVIRDGRDIISSALKSDFVLPKRQFINYRHWRRFLPDSDFKILCRMFQAESLKLSAFLESNRSSELQSRFTVFRFEDIYLKSDEQIPILLDFCSLDESHFDWQRFRNMAVRGSSFLKNEQGKIDFGTGIRATGSFHPIGRWQEWPSRWQRHFKSVCGNAMQKLGYEI